MLNFASFLISGIACACVLHNLSANSLYFLPFPYIRNNHHDMRGIQIPIKKKNNKVETFLDVSVSERTSCHCPKTV